MTDEPDVPSGASYDLLRRRLASRVGEATAFARSIDARRVETFGSIPVRLTGSDRLRTDLACAPRDMARVGDVVMLGFNVSLDLASVEPEHVFALYKRGDDGELLPLVAGDESNFLSDRLFRDEFSKLHRFYGKARFVDLRAANGQLLAAFQIGDRIEDVAVLRWAVTQGGQVSFVDARGERDYRWPEAHDFSWVACGRDDQVAGAHPAVAVLDEVFVGFRNGRLQLRIEDGTPGGSVGLEEAVDVAGQSLADVSVSYARIGEHVVALRVGLYSESARHYLYNRRTRRVERVDAIGSAARTLPGGEGVVFPGGYHLATLGTRVFDVDTSKMVFEEVVASPNGEDLMYVFHRRDSGEYLLAPYNLVRREVAQVIPCHGFAVFEDGQMLLFRGSTDDAEPKRVHPVQWWSTPFVSDELLATGGGNDEWIARIGNADLVSGLADVFDVERLLNDSDPSERTWEDLISAARRSLDTNLWMADPEAGDLHRAMRDIVETSGLLVDEYAKVRRLRAQAAEQLASVASDVASQVASALAAETPVGVVAGLGATRRLRGQVALLEDTPEIDDTALSELLAEVDGAIESLAMRAGTVLDDDGAFDLFVERLDDLVSEGSDAATVAELDVVTDRLWAVTSDLDALVDAIGSLDGIDTAARTRIVRRVADVIAASNRSRAILDGRRKALGDAESAEAFDAELALIEQSISGSVMGTSTPDEVDAELARLLVNAERLESRHGDDPERLMRIVEIRDQINEVFGSRRAELVDQRSQRARRLSEAGRRLLVTVARQASEAGDEAAVASLFASDPMVQRVRTLADELAGLGETGQAAELRDALRAETENARRTVRDRRDLGDAQGTLRFGPFRFAPNGQPFEAVMSAVGGRVSVEVTGTDYSFDVTDDLSGYADLTDRTYPSETRDVARCEFLAWAVYSSSVEQGSLAELRAAAATPGRLAEIVRATAESRHGEGYEIGVHDHDATAILAGLLLSGGEPIGQPGWARAAARVFMGELDQTRRSALGSAVDAGRLALDAFGTSEVLDRIRSDVASSLGQMLDIANERDALVVARYICDHLPADGASLPASSTAIELASRFDETVAPAIGAVIEGSLESMDAAGRHAELERWVSGLVNSDPALSHFDFDVAEAAALLATRHLGHAELPVAGAVEISGLVSEHRRIADSSLTLRLDELASRVGPLFDEMADRWPEYQATRRRVTETVRQQIELDSHRPSVMAGFVRNRLIDETLLPLIGANLARQLGTVDSDDLSRSGLLVLTSPPGYGKTTLIAWMAARLGLLMVKVNGPALGHDTTSLDPGDAPNAAARAEVEKINLALQFGRNVLLFVDDIQFANPELLSRFIPLADATRRVEGVVGGRATTFDLRGKRFAVVMAGNPYSKVGSRFELPDMLVNRADVYNLGDVADEHGDRFALSYIENSITACPDLASRSIKLLDDVEAVLAMARGRRVVSSDGLAHRWDAGELDETVRVIRLLDKAASTVRQVNDAYVSSAAMADGDREEPPFLLQGSYRNMARIASRIVPAMTDSELEAVIDEHYASEAQTLTDRAEQNLLALAALRGGLDDSSRVRWETICENFARSTAGPAAEVVTALGRIADALGSSDS